MEVERLKLNVRLRNEKNVAFPILAREIFDMIRKGDKEEIANNRETSKKPNHAFSAKPT